jgi:hypothetical protein
VFNEYGALKLTAGGNLDGACEKVGDLRAKPYAADYIFLKRMSP